MLSNYLTIAWRNLRKNKVFSAIHVVGLALGVCSCLSIYLYVNRELRYDQFHQYEESVYRVNMATKWGEDEGKRSTTPPSVAQHLMREIPEVVVATRIYQLANEAVFCGTEVFKEDQILGTDSQFFDVFTFPLLQGSAKNALQEPYSVVLTETAARKYFGEVNRAMGQSLQIGKEKTVFKVTGIAQDVPAASHFQFGLLTSIHSYPNVKRFDWSWVWTQMVTYVRLRPGTNPTSLEAKLARIVETHAAAAFERLGFPYEQFKASNNYWKLYLQPLHRIWLHSSDTGNKLGSLGNIFFVYVFSFIGVFILVLACINFINLSTAGATRRAHEIGLRKTLGTSRGQLIYQFMTEAGVVCLVAVLAGFTLAQLFTRQLNQLGLGSFVLSDLGASHLMLISIVFVLLLTLLAGFYPAFYLSGFDTLKALKGHLRYGKSVRTFRNALVVFQFGISISLILVTIVANKQIRFLRENDLGFNQQHLLVINNADQLGQGQEAFKNQILNLPGVAKASLSAYTFPNFYQFEDTYQPRGGRVKDVTLTSIVADHDFLGTLGLRLKKGRDFRKDNAGDQRSVILNEMAAQLMGWTDPIGQTLEYPGYGSDDNRFTVIGVIHDFHPMPINFPQQPLAIFLTESGHATNEELFVIVRLQGNTSASVKALEGVWHESSKGWPFQYSFVEDGFRAAYQAYEDTQGLFLTFACLAIAISCLGLFGLAVFATNTRTKEIGIRKVLGAPVSGLILMLNREFAGLIVLAFLIGTPLGYLLIEQWLQDFAIRTPINWSDCVLPGLLAFLIALATVSYLSLKAARQNPVKALRYE